MSASATVLQTLWHWVREREAIRVKKEVRRDPPPWTTDPILAAYRFCNVRREDDLVTRWVRDHVRIPFADHPLLWLMLCVCRQINWPDTLRELIETEGAWPSHAGFAPERMARVLNDRRDRGDKVYTGAYLIPAPHEPGADKQTHVACVVLGDLHRRATEFGAGDDWSGRTLRRAHELVRRTHGWGPFLAYQAVVDMRFCPRLLEAAPDRSTWAAAGPGTIRGLHRVHGREVGSALSQERALDEMRALYEIAEQETGVPMDFSDIPNILCELDKYLRTQHGDGRPRARYVPGRGA